MAAAQTTVEFEVCFRSAGEAGKAEACWSTWNGGETHLGDLTASTLAPQNPSARGASAAHLLGIERARGPRASTAIQKRALSPNNSVALQD